MRKIRLYTAVILALALVVTLCSCKKKAETTNSVPQTSASANDEADPENTEKSGEQGTEIEIKKAVIKEGCANGIDVSKWQGKINWKAVKAAGIDFAIIRIGFRGENGNIYKDDCADYNIQQAEKNGVLVGVYFFSTAVNTAEAEEMDRKRRKRLPDILPRCVRLRGLFKQRKPYVRRNQRRKDR